MESEAGGGGLIDVVAVIPSHNAVPITAPPSEAETVSVKFPWAMAEPKSLGASSEQVPDALVVQVEAK